MNTIKGWISTVVLIGAMLVATTATNAGVITASLTNDEPTCSASETSLTGVITASLTGVITASLTGVITASAVETGEVCTTPNNGSEKESSLIGVITAS
jgi:hypothetical protein